VIRRDHLAAEQVVGADAEGDQASVRVLLQVVHGEAQLRAAVGHVQREHGAVAGTAPGVGFAAVARCTGIDHASARLPRAGGVDQVQLERRGEVLGVAAEVGLIPVVGPGCGTPSECDRVAEGQVIGCAANLGHRRGVRGRLRADGGLAGAGGQGHREEQERHGGEAAGHRYRAGWCVRAISRRMSRGREGG
jgi:hypothetical protein